MRGLGTLVNIIAVLVGSTAGVFLEERLGEKVRGALMGVIGLTTAVVGVSNGILSKNILIPLGSLLIGAIIGESLNIEGRIEKFSESVEKKFHVEEATFTEGFVTASIVFCVGPMAIIGSINDGLSGNIEILLLKSMLDGFVAVGFASALGWGVSLSVISIFIYQGTLTTIGTLLGNVFSPEMIREMTAAGGILILGIGLKLLKIKKLKLANMLPGLFITPLVVYVLQTIKIPI